MRALKPSLRGIAAVAPHADDALLGFRGHHARVRRGGPRRGLLRVRPRGLGHGGGRSWRRPAGRHGRRQRAYNPLTRQIVAAGACHGDLRALVDTCGGARLDDGIAPSACINIYSLLAAG